MTDTMHAHPVSSGPGVGDDEAAAERRLANSRQPKQSLPWEMNVSDEPSCPPDGTETDSVPATSDPWAENAAIVQAPTIADTAAPHPVAPAAMPPKSPPVASRLPMLIAVS